MSTQCAQTQTLDAKARKRQRLERKKIHMEYLKKAREKLPEYTQLEYGKQLLSAFFLFSMWSFVPVITAIGPIWLLFTSYWYWVIIYGIWLIYDWRTPLTGGRHIKWWRSCGIWQNLARYYPVSLVKTADLPPNRNYILGSHPHGFWCTGVFTHLLTDATNFGEEFPGLTPYLLTLDGQFWFPVRRDVGINMGGVMASAESLEYLLKTKNEGRIIGIVIGGAAEVLEAHMGRHTLVLSKRRGFCKYALKYGAWLVPSYSFGENDIFFQVPNRKGSRLRKIQEAIKNRIGFCPPLYFGRGLFNRVFGLLPLRRPIVTVVGRPIPVKKSEGEPTKEEMDALHAEYTKQLIELFEEHKENYGIAPDRHLQIL